MIIDKNSDSSIDLDDWLRRSTDESELLARTDMLHSAQIKDVYLGQTLDRFITDVEYDPETSTIRFIYNTSEEIEIVLNGNGGDGSGCNCDMTEYDEKLSSLETEVSELESKIPTSTSSLVNDSDFVNQAQVDDRIKEVVGAAPEALDTLQEISKALGDDPDFAATITNQITEVKSLIPSVEGLATEKYVDDSIAAIPAVDFTPYATKEEVKIVESKIPSIEGLATESWVTEKIEAIEIPSIEGLATEAYVGQTKSDIEKWVEEQGYLTEHQDISNLATKDEIKDVVRYSEFTYNDQTRKTIQLANYDSISGIDTKGAGHNLAMVSKWDVADFGAVGLHMNLNSTDKVTINDNEFVATESWVNKQGFLTEHQDISSLATKDEVKEIESKIPSIEGLATEKYVDDAVAAIEHPSVDLTGYATEEWVEQRLAEIEAGDNIDPTSLVTKTELKNELAAVEAKIPNIEGLATETYVNEKIEAIEHPQVDLTPYAKSEDVTKAISESAEATKTWVGEQGYLTEHQDISDVVKYRNFTYEGEERKTIDLANYDTISGRDTKGDSHSLVMVSKWDVADFSSPKVHTNINTLTTTDVATDAEGNNPYVDGLTIYNNDGEVSEHVPVVTVNDKFALATVNHMMAIREADAQANADKYQPKGDYATKDYVIEEIAKVSTNGEIDLSNYATKAWVEEQGFLTESAEFVTSLATKEELNSKLAVLNSNFQWKDNVVTFDDIAKVYPNPEEGFSVYVDDEQTTYVYIGGEWVAAVSSDETPVATEEMDGLMPASALRKLNTLENYDDSALQGDMTTLEAKLAILEEKFSSMSKTNVQSITATGSLLSLGDASKDYVIQGDLSQKLTVAASKSVTISDAEISNDAKMTIKSAGDVELKKITTSGEFTKTDSNCIINIPEAESVVIKDMVVNSTQYNGIEVGIAGSVLPKSVVIDNCDFSGEFSNNVISIHGTQNDAVINISNCKFSSVSNPLRISNRTGAKVTINVTNCSCDKWELGSYAGFLLCQDFTSTTVEDAAANNLFGNDKVTINFINFTMPGGVRLTKPEDMSTICGSGDDSQLIYVYRNADAKADSEYKLTAYGDGSAYPKINII